MVILLIMAMGVLVGLRFFPEKWQKQNGYVQLISILVLIFCMGVSLGSNPNFMDELVGFGIKGLVFAIVPIVCSIAGVYLLTHKWMKGNKDD